MMACQGQAICLPGELGAWTIRKSLLYTVDNFPHVAAIGDMELQAQGPRRGHNRPFLCRPPMLRAIPSYLNFTRAYAGRDKLDLYPLMLVICSIKLLYASNMPADLVCLLFRPFVSPPSLFAEPKRTKDTE